MESSTTLYLPGTTSSLGLGSTHLSTSPQSFVISTLALLSKQVIESNKTFTYVNLMVSTEASW